MQQIEVIVSYFMGYGHSGGHYSDRKRSKQVSDKVAEVLQSMLTQKKSARKKPYVLTSKEIDSAIKNGESCLSALHADLLKSDTASEYVITAVGIAKPKVTTTKDEYGAVFSKNGKVLIKFPQESEDAYIVPKKVRIIQRCADPCSKKYLFILKLSR